MITRSCPWLRYSFSNAGALAYHIAMKLAKTLRLDVSDTHVFNRAAEVGEWAITGTFAYIDSDPSSWSRKKQLAFRTAWLGIGSFGNSTFVQATEISTQEFDQTLQTLAAYLAEEYNAPSQEAATKAARQELDDMINLCGHPAGTLLAIERTITEQNITEKTRVLIPSDEPINAKTWTVVEDK